MHCTFCGAENPDIARYCIQCGRDLVTTTPVSAIHNRDEAAELALVKAALAGEYEVVRELGRGGMGIVYRARERQLERDVAIKVLPFSLTFDAEFVERFQREARTAAQLEHPNVIPIYRVGRMGRVIFFTMKYLRGGSLAQRITEHGPIPPLELARLLADTAAALGYAHARGIVHRDVKPDNIMFDELGHCVVTDFGIAKAASGRQLTGTGMAIGTPHYMSPEQVRAQHLDGRSDLYSLGVVAYQALTGVVPFDGTDAFAIGYKHVTEELPIPPLHAPAQQDLFVVIRRMMAKDPAQRFQAAEDVVQALVGDHHRRSPAMPLGAFSGAAVPRIPSLAAETPTTPMPPQPSARVERSREEWRTMATGLFVFLVVVLGLAGGGGWWLHQQGLLLPELRFGRGAPAAGDSVPADTATAGPAAAAAAGSAPADTAAPLAVADAPGHLELAGLPPDARVMIDGQLVEGRAFDLAPGVYDVRATAQGFDPVQRDITVVPGLRQVEPIVMAPSLPPCVQLVPDTTVYNRERRCYDVPPVPGAPLEAPIPEGAVARPTALVIWAHVSPEGRTLEVREKRTSDDPRFTQGALEHVRRLTWRPALKSGRPVAAWIEVVIEPAAGR